MKKINIRLLKIGESIADIPIIECPICQRSAIDLGFDSLEDDQTFAHIITLTKYSGEIYEACYKKLSV